MTAYNLYCDESRHTSDPSQNFAVIGVLQCPRDQKHRIVGRIHSLMTLHNVRGEFGWKKLSQNRRVFYETLLDVFIEESSLSFRCIVVDKSSLDHNRWNNGDKELGFYKLYYQLLVHWLKPGNEYHIYLDWQQNSCSNRFEELRRILIHKLTGRAKILCLEPVSSHNQPLIQLSDVLMGTVGYQWNNLDSKPESSVFKSDYVQKLASMLNRPRLSMATGLNEQKFNIFKWQGQ